MESTTIENKLHISGRLNRVFNAMPKNRLRDIIIDITSGGRRFTNLTQNYIDISGNNEELTFISNRKANIILENRSIEYICNRHVSTKHLTLRKNNNGEFKNRSLFNRIGFTPIESGDNITTPPKPGTVGTIINEIAGDRPGYIYALFMWDNGKTFPVNKVCLDSKDDTEEKIWKRGRNPIRIGRLVRSILKSAGEKFTEKEIENFVNSYKSTYDIINNAFLKFKIVSGGDIAKWYHGDNYENGGSSTLGNSCMKSMSYETFDIYCDNPQCSMVILLSDKGEIIDGEWSSEYIKGRALLWKTDDNEMFMDRIYTNNDSDVELFKEFANKNGWWYKREQDSDSYFTAVKGDEICHEKEIVVTLDCISFENYPYIDTLTYGSTDCNKLSNKANLIDADREFNDTDGEFSYF